MSNQARRVAVLGGGMAGLAAAMQLAESGENLDITVYQMGWRLGGKCASGRNDALCARIQEHGLHVWFGCYDNAFGLLRRCYDQLGLGNVLGQFSGVRNAPIMDCRDGSADCAPPDWEIVPIPFPKRKGTPGDEHHALTILEILSLLREFANGNWRDSLSSTFNGNEVAEIAALFASYRESAATTRSDALRVIDVSPWYRENVPQILTQLQAAWERDAWQSTKQRLLRAAIALGLAAAAGLAWERPNELSDLDNKDLREWLRQYLIRGMEWVLESAPLRALYDLCFAYVNGSTSRPNFAAGAALHAAVRLGLTYHGDFVLYQMRGGMGDVVAAPLYAYLSKLGVRFQFFHRVEELVLTDSGTDIGAVRLTQQAVPKDYRTPYSPLLEPLKYGLVGSWPSEPLYDQLRDGDTGVDFESRWGKQSGDAVWLNRGQDFDDVVLAIPPAELQIVAGALAAARKTTWAPMLAALKSVQTIGVQLWMNKTPTDLGWPASVGAVPVDAAPEPLDVWSDRSELLKHESDCDDPALSLWYGCGPFEGVYDPAKPDEPTRALYDARRLTVRWLATRGAALWPRATTGTAFDFSVLRDPSGGSGGARITAQYVRANIEPTERYVLSVKGSTKYRLAPGGSGFSNLVLAGDWTSGEWNAGCVEAAVSSGLDAANALLARTYTVRPQPDEGYSPSQQLPKRALILGGGVGGLSAAHELMDRGYRVEVVERNYVVGGKARSIPLEGTGVDGRPDLPGEHGFRFFPGFYQHLIDTLGRITLAERVDSFGRPETVKQHLVAGTTERIARDGAPPIDLPAHLGLPWPGSLREVLAAFISQLRRGQSGLTAADISAFVARIVRLMTMCPARAEVDLERVSWWEFMDADNHSEAYQKLLVTAVTRSLVAAKAKEAAARPGGLVLVQLLYAAMRSDSSPDHVLNGPTSEVWLEPWRRYLEARGVRFRLGTEVVQLEMQTNRIASVIVRNADGTGAESSLSADHYVAAVPVEVMTNLLTPDVLRADPTLHGIQVIANDVDWMNGVLFFLNCEVPLVRGHVTYIDSPWAITSISQAQFWPGGMSRFGGGDVREILSVVVSDWTEARKLTCGDADACRARVISEVWEQVKRSVNVEGKVLLTDDMRVISWIDPDIIFGPAPVENREPLLVNKKDKWPLRPDAYTAIPNLFLASDYVKTNTNLATMEAANEAARRAVNAILTRDARPADVGVWPLFVPPAIKVLQDIDCAAYKLGIPWTMPSALADLDV